MDRIRATTTKPCSHKAQGLDRMVNVYCTLSTALGVNNSHVIFTSLVKLKRHFYVHIVSFLKLYVNEGAIFFSFSSLRDDTGDPGAPSVRKFTNSRLISSVGLSTCRHCLPICVCVRLFYCPNKYLLV